MHFTINLGLLYEKQFMMGDYCSLHNKATYPVSGFRSDIETGAIGSGLYCSVNRNVTLGDPWKTGDPNRARPKNNVSSSSKKTSKPPSMKRSAYEMQASFLPELKRLKPELKETSAATLQNAAKQVDTAFSRFFKGQSKHPTYQSAKETDMNYPDSECKLDAINEKIYFPGVGWVKFVNSRPFWNGMKFSKFTVTLEIDQWYVSVFVKDESVPDPELISPDDVQTIVGGDKGIKKLLSVSGNTQFHHVSGMFKLPSHQRFKS